MIIEMGSDTRLRYKTAATFKRKSISIRLKMEVPSVGAPEEESIP